MTSEEWRALLNGLSDSELHSVSWMADTILRGRRRAAWRARARGVVVPIRREEGLGPGCIVFGDECE